MVKQSYTKKDRLKKSKSIEHLFKFGNNLNFYPLKLIYSVSSIELKKDQFSPCQIAFITPKRQFKKAVDRNKIKRKMREAFRKNKELLYKVLLSNHKCVELAVIFNGNQDTEYTTIEKQMLAVFEVLINKCLKE